MENEVAHEQQQEQELVEEVEALNLQNKRVLCFDTDSAASFIKANCDNIETSQWSEVEGERVIAHHAGSHTFSAVAIGNTVYILTWSTHVFSIDSSKVNQRWVDLPNTQHGHGAEPPVAAYDGRIYVCGGGWEESTAQLPNGSRAQRLSRLCEVLNTNGPNRQWENIKEMQYEKRRNSIIEAQDKIYCIGGFGNLGTTATADGHDANAFNVVEMYDPGEDTWVEKAPLRIPRVAPGVAKYDKWIFALGGGSGGQYLDSIECYNTSNDLWQDLMHRMQEPRMKFVAQCLDNEIIIVGGERGGSRSIEKIEVTMTAGADVIALRNKERTECFNEREIESMATVFIYS